MENTIPKFEIEKTLVINTGHICKFDFQYAKEQAQGDQTSVKHPELMVENHRFGVVVILGAPESRSAMISDLSGNFSDEFCNCLILASSLGMDNVRFDEDGTIYEFLPTIDWED